MAEISIPKYLEAAYEDGFSFKHPENYIYNFYTKEIGKIKLAEGSIVACDPLMYVNDLPYTTKFPIGEFPVELAIAKIESDERVAFARIKFSDEAPVSWTLAATEGQDLSVLTGTQIYGFSVDGGTGCFMEPSAGKDINDFLEADVNNYQVLTNKMQENAKATWHWLVWPGKEANVVMFATGWGDGFFGTYIGFDKSGNVCRLVSDFVIIE